MCGNVEHAVAHARAAFVPRVAFPTCVAGFLLSAFRWRPPVLKSAACELQGGPLEQNKTTSNSGARLEILLGWATMRYAKHELPLGRRPSLGSRWHHLEERMILRTMRVAGLAGFLASTLFTPVLAQQAAPGADASMTCRLFPLACPGPVPTPPPPLMGAPEEQAQAPTEAPPKPKHRASKRVRKHSSQ